MFSFLFFAVTSGHWACYSVYIRQPTKQRLWEALAKFYCSWKVENHFHLQHEWCKAEYAGIKRWFGREQITYFPLNLCSYHWRIVSQSCLIFRIPGNSNGWTGIQTTVWGNTIPSYIEKFGTEGSIYSTKVNLAKITEGRTERAPTPWNDRKFGTFLGQKLYVENIELGCEKFLFYLFADSWLEQDNDIGHAINCLSANLPMKLKALYLNVSKQPPCLPPVWFSECKTGVQVGWRSTGTGQTVINQHNIENIASYGQR